MSYQPPANPANAYLQRQVEQASPTQTLLLLLDGAIKFELQAKDAIARADVEGRYNANKRAIEIITFLISQQDESQGEAAVRLLRIYTNLMRQMMRVDFENSTALCDNIVSNLRMLRQGFASLQPASNVVAAPSTPEGLARKLAASA